jgi:uncharacterized membrane protein
MSDESFGEQQQPDEPTWTYRGHRLKASEFVSAIAHQFRAEIQRTNVWRTRLDATTNWAVVVTGVSISIAFSQPKTHHGVLVLNAMLISLFLFIEARRYRYYELWSCRVRGLETGFFAAMLVPPFHPSPEWAEDLAENVLSFNFPISMLEAIGLRLRRNYLWIFLILSIAWFAKYWLFPTPPANFNEFLSRAAIGPMSGPIVVSLSVAYFGVLALVALFTMSMAHVSGEVSPQAGMDIRPTLGAKSTRAHGKAKGARAWFGSWQRKQQFLVFILTDKTDAVAKRILNELGRGVTSMAAGEGSTVLMCALSATEIKKLKAVIAEEDPQASVILTSAQEVLGRGFDQLLEA